MISSFPTETDVPLSLKNDHSHIIPDILITDVDEASRDLNFLEKFKLIENPGNFFQLSPYTMITERNCKDIINTKDENGNSPLHIAISRKKFELMEFLLNNDANINSVNNRENTPLYYAVSFGYIDYCQFLISN